MKTIAIVIPVYNEEARLAGCFRALSSWKPPKGLSLEQVIFVDDGSDDNSISKIKNQKLKIENKLKTSVKIISYPSNRGKGYAIARGMEASDSDYTIFIDADMATPLSQVSKIVPSMLKAIDVIVGTRKNGVSTVVCHQPVYREILGRGFTYLTNIILNTWVTDFTCGFKAFSRRAKDTVFPTLSVKRWAFDAEAIYKARKMGLTIAEIPVLWSDKKGSKVSVLSDVPTTLADLLRIRLANFAPVRPIFSAVRYALSVLL